MEPKNNDQSKTIDPFEGIPSSYSSPSPPHQQPQDPFGEGIYQSPIESLPYSIEESTQYLNLDSQHYSLEENVIHQPPLKSPHLPLDDSIIHPPPLQIPRHFEEDNVLHPFIESPHNFLEKRTLHSIEESSLQSPPNPSHHFQEERAIHSPLESSHHSLEVTKIHPPLESSHRSLEETKNHSSLECSCHSLEQIKNHLPLESSHQSQQHSRFHGEIRDNFLEKFTHQSIQESPCQSPQELPHYSAQEPHHDSLDKTSCHSTQHPQTQPPQHPPTQPSQHSRHKFPPMSPMHSYSSLHLSQHASINVDQPSSSHGVQDEFKEDKVFHGSQVGVQESIPSTILSFISDGANVVLDFLLPPLPPKSTTSAIPEVLQMDTTPQPHKLYQRDHVAFTTDHNNTRMPPTSLDEVVINSTKDGKRLRKLSSRFYRVPFQHGPSKEYTLRELFCIAYQTLGVVYGDLGTSPLYVYPTINFSNPTEQDYLGVLSLIFWTLTLIGVLKYSIIVLQADDHGEGGTFAMYSLLCQHANIGQHQGEVSPIEDMDGRRLSHLCKLEDKPKFNRTKAFLENNRTAQKVLLFVVMMATCMLIGDGILTPAISVISAIEGIQTQTPNLSTAVIVIISAIILVLLFLVQRFGTRQVSLLFSPIMALWFITTPLIGVYNIAKHYPGIFKAISPAHIIYFFRDNGKQAWLMLGGTVLCITGSEAMYADLGHFNKRSIQIAFCLMVYPSVLLTYSGQTSYLIAHPQDHSQGFFKMIPQRIFWPMFVISTLAAIVASQGLISATFSIIKQSVALDYFPRVKLVHTSDDKEGQIYSPEVNYILMVLCLAVVFGFRRSATIGNAFGVAVVFVMLITTCLTSLVMLVIWGCRLVFVAGFFVLFFVMESIYVSSVVTKVRQGGWLPFVVALVVTLIMFTWNMGCQAKYRYEMNNQITKQSFGNLLSEVQSVRVPGICFFYTDLMSGVPPIVQHYVSNVRSFHRVLVFTTVRFLPVTTVLPSERFLVGRAGFDGVYRCVARYGYRDTMRIQNNEFLDQFLRTLIDYIQSDEDSSRRKSILSDHEEISHTGKSIQTEISSLKQAREDGAVYVMGRGELKVSKNTKFITRVLVGNIYKFLRANCRSEVSAMDIPYAQYLEIGMLYNI